MVCGFREGDLFSFLDDLANEILPYIYNRDNLEEHYYVYCLRRPHGKDPRAPHHLGFLNAKTTKDPYVTISDPPAQNTDRNLRIRHARNRRITLATTGLCNLIYVYVYICVHIYVCTYIMYIYTYGTFS